MGKRAVVDELKLLGLLWRASPPGPRSGISTESVTARAVELADQEGIEAVTIRRLAHDVGVTAMALYPHIGGSAELVELMLDQVAGETYQQLPIPQTDDWRNRVTAIAEANWELLQRHPWIHDVAPIRSVPGPGASTKYETELHALDNIGLTDIAMEHTLTALLALVQGTSRAARAAKSSRAPSEVDDSSWWSTIEPALAAAMGDPTRFPTASRVGQALGAATGTAGDPEGAYRRGLNLVLTAVAVEARGAGGES